MPKTLGFLILFFVLYVVKSSRNGDVGIVHYIQDIKDQEWLINKGPHAPYTALMTHSMFNQQNIMTLKHSGKINGILVYYNQSHLPSNGFSADETCPNNKYSAYGNNETLKDCKQVEWNPYGEGLMFMDHEMPIIALKNHTEFKIIVEQCYNKFNKPEADGSARTFPLCSALLKDAMDAAKDTPTCIRRSNLVLNLNPDRYCDPLGDYNVFMTTQLLNNSQELPDDHIIIAAAKLDGFSLFDKLYPSVDGTVSGFVTLLAAANVLSQYKDTLQDTGYKPIMFSFFQGETFDYIGSSRMVYDMIKGHFPWAAKPGDHGVHPINITNIGAWLEVSQVGIKDQGMWLHTDPVTRNNKVQDIVSYITEEAEPSGVKVGTPDLKHPLPPVSLHSFLRKHPIPGVVIAEHQDAFINKYYNSRFDVASTINHTYPHDLLRNETYDYITPAADHLATVATLVARSLYRMATNKTVPVGMSADPLLVTHLIYCFLNHTNCSLVREVLHPKNLDSWNKNTSYSVYVGVSSSSMHIISHIVHRLMTYWWGEEVPVPPGKECVDYYKKDPYYLYVNVSGPSPGKHFENSTCLKSLVNISVAKSPAFDIPDYDWTSGEYSSWSESVWAVDAIKVQIFLRPDPNLEVATLCVGIVMFALSLPLVFVGAKRAHMLFR